MGERRLRKLAKALCDKLRLVHASEEYKSIWSFAHTHGLSYDGPTYTAELYLLEECLHGEAKEPELRPNDWPHVPLPKKEPPTDAWEGWCLDFAEQMGNLFYMSDVGREKLVSVLLKMPR